MDAGEITAIATLVCSVFVALGVTGIDAGMVSSVITGLVSLIGIGSAGWSWYAHRQKAGALKAAGVQN